MNASDDAGPFPTVRAARRDDRFLSVWYQPPRMKRRRFVAVVTATTAGFAGCSSPEREEGEGEDGEGEENGGSGPYGRIEGPQRPAVP